MTWAPSMPPEGADVLLALVFVGGMIGVLVAVGAGVKVSVGAGVCVAVGCAAEVKVA